MMATSDGRFAVASTRRNSTCRTADFDGTRTYLIMLYLDEAVSSLATVLFPIDPSIPPIKDKE
jgi:hypothetical protein